MTAWTVDHEVDQPIRHVRVGGGDRFAAITLRLAPDLDDGGVRFVNAVAGEAAAFWGSFVERGVRLFVERRVEEGRPAGYLTVTLVGLETHPIDSRDLAFIEAAEMAMSRAFEAHEVALDV